MALALGRTTILLACLALLATGCGTRSISNSGFYADSDRGYGRTANPDYKGELSEFNVLGIDPRANVSETDIQHALTSKARLTLAKRSSLMLVQSGAAVPDHEMSRELERYYNVTAFTGAPESEAAGNENYSRALRLAAARGGNDKLVAYWGWLETGRENHATKLVSWVPLVGSLLPDETQRMRIRLKLAVVDVMSGQWTMFTPQPFEDVDTSARLNRVASDQGQVAALKEKGYRAAVDELVQRFAR